MKTIFKIDSVGYDFDIPLDILIREYMFFLEHKEKKFLLITDNKLLLCLPREEVISKKIVIYETT